MGNIRYKIEKILNNNIEGIYNIVPIGHHELGRHYVYNVTDKEGNEFILKVYGKEERWCTEVTALKLLENYKFCTDVLDYGKLDDGTGWIFLKKIPGVVLNDVWKELKYEDKVSLIEEIGEYLGLIHRHSTYHYYGIWIECGGRAIKYSNFMKYRLDNDRKIISDVFKYDIPDKDLLKKAYNIMVKYYDKINNDKQPRICHHDFCGRNIIVIKEKERWRVSGIIDFEHCCPDDPDVDIANLYHKIFLDEPSLKNSFLEGYEKHMILTENYSYKIKYYLLRLSLQVCSWAYEYAHDYYKECIRLLKLLFNKLEEDI